MTDLPDTLTFLFTDIEGSTHLWELHPDAMQQALSRHDAILRVAIEGNGGRVFKTVGDAFYGAFPYAPSALRAALEAQRSLATAQWQGIGALRVRMALHSGEAQARDEDYFGPALNRVARLLAAGHGEQVLLSQACEELVRDALPVDVTLRDLGERRLKDLAQPSRVFQLIAPDLPSEFPPLKTLDNHPNNLPQQTSPLIGREKSVIEARSLLLDSNVRLLTLTGPGGTGKTRLSLQIAADVLHHFEDGAFFVALAPLSDAALVPVTIGQVLGVKETADKSIVESLQEHLREKKMLLVLDNFEQVVQAGEAIAALLAACSGLKVLVSSRIALHLSGEHEFPVPPLELPCRKPPPPLGVLSEYAAVQLFIQRAQAVRPDFAVTNENAPAVAEICVRLDGLPLAIELAAARSKVLPPQALLSRLENRLNLLTGGARDLPQRQQTLRGAIAWSYDLLEEDEKVLFRRLSVFVGGCTLEAAEAVCGEGLTLDVLDGVCSLVDKSLLKQEDDETGEPRFRMLETIREFGLEQLEASSEESETRRRHAQHFLTLVPEAKMETLATPLTDLKPVKQNRDNFRSALDWSLDRDVETAARLAGAMTSFWTLTSRPEGLRQTGRLIPLIDSLPAALQIQLLAMSLQFSIRYSPPQQVQELCDRLLALSRQENERHGIEMAFHFQAVLAVEQGEPQLALENLHNALSIQRENAAPLRIGLCLVTMGDIQNFRLGDFAEARNCYQEARGAFEQIGYVRGVAKSCSRLALLAGHDGNIAEAHALYDKAVEVFKEYDDKPSLAWCWLGLGELALKENNLDIARIHLIESLEIFNEQGVSDRVPDVLLRLACLAAKHQQWTHAARLTGAHEMLANALRIPGNDEHLAFIINHAKAALGESAFETELAAGRAMPLEEAVVYAMVNNADDDTR